MIVLVSGMREIISKLPEDKFGHLVEIRKNKWGLPSRALIEKLSERKWAADNGGFSGLEEQKFEGLLSRMEGVKNCLFVVAPDVVYNMERTLQKLNEWLPKIKAKNLPVALALQDGLNSETRLPWDDLDCLFIGGSTRFKYSQIVREFVAEAIERHKWVHCGRCNTPRRIRYMIGIGVNSIDGSGFSINAKHIRIAHKVLSSYEGQGSLPLVLAS